MKKAVFELSKHSHVVCEVPERMQEMTARQFLAVAGLTKGWLKEDAFFCQFFGLQPSVLSGIDAYQLYVLTQQLEFLRKAEPMEAFVIGTLTALQDGRKVTLTAPGRKLGGMTFQQFMSVDQFYNWYVYTEKEDFLLSMLASLYLCEGEVFEELVLSERIEDIRSVKENRVEILDAVAMQWPLIRLWLARSYSFLFPGGSGEPGQQQKKEKPQSWLAVFDALVGDDLTRIESYRRLPALDVLRIVNRRIKDQQMKGGR